MRTIKYVAMCLALCATTAFAGTFTFNTSDAGVGTLFSSGGPQTVDASATIVTSLNTVTVTLSDNLNNPTDAGQLLSDIFFTLSGTVGASSISSSSGTALTVNSDGSFTVGGTVTPHWTLASSGDTLHLAFAGGPPNNLIIGGSSDGNYTSGTYSSNNSIAGNGPHNPFLESGASFTLAVAGVNSDTTVSNVFFSFGTDQQSFPSTPPSTPDSGSTLMLLGAVLGAGEVLRRTFAKRSAAARCKI
jgi:hypothetical protein